MHAAITLDMDASLGGLHSEMTDLSIHIEALALDKYPGEDLYLCLVHGGQTMC